MKYYTIIFLLMSNFIFDSTGVLANDKTHQEKLSTLQNNINLLSELQDKNEFENNYAKYHSEIMKLNASDEDLHTMIYQRIMFYYYTEMNTDTIQKYITELCDYYERSNNIYQYYYTYCVLADAHIANGSVKKGIEVGQRMLRRAKEKKEDIGIALSGHALAMAYMTMQDYSKAEAHFRQAIPIMKQQKMWSIYVISSCNYMGVLIDQEKYSQAKKMFVELDSIADASLKSRNPYVNDVLVLYIKSVEASQLYLGLKDARSMKKYKDYVEAYYKKNPDMTKTYLYQMRMRYAEVIGDNNERLICADSLLTFYEGDLSNRFRLYKNKAEAFEDLGDYKSALKFYKLYQVDKDSVNSKDSREMTAQLSAEYDNLSLELDNKNLELKVRNQQFKNSVIIICGTIFMIIVISVFVVYLLSLNRRLKKSLSIKDDFIHHITHEIRTPLNYMMGFGDILSEKYKDIDDGETSMMVKEMHSGADELLKMFSDILLLSDLDSGKAICNKSEHDIKDICREQINKIYPNIKDGVTFSFDCDEAEMKCMTNIDSISYIIFNLLHNAVKFTQRGEILLSCKKNEEGRFVIKVFNSGKVLTADDEKIIFSRFRKLDTFTQGLGLGLYISRMHAERIGAELYLNTTCKNGTEFCVIL